MKVTGNLAANITLKSYLHGYKPMTLEKYIELIVRATSRRLGHLSVGNYKKASRYNDLRMWLEDRCVRKFG